MMFKLLGFITVLMLSGLCRPGDTFRLPFA